MNSLQIDKNKDYTLEELKAIREGAYQFQRTIADLIQAKELEGKAFTGKFVKSRTYGNMYVTWQRFDKSTNGGQDFMFFQGLGVDSFLGEYHDSSWFDYNACKEWNIPIRMFDLELRRGEFVEITKEQFLKELKEHTNVLFNHIGEHLYKLEHADNDE